MTAADPLNALLELVRAAAREGTTEALMLRPGALSTAPPLPLLDKRALAHALGVSTASVDRLCRQGRIPFVLVGEVRRFDLEAVRLRSALTMRRRRRRAAPALISRAPPLRCQVCACSVAEALDDAPSLDGGSRAWRPGLCGAVCGLHRVDRHEAGAGGC